MSEPKTVAGAYAKIEAHEDLCAERYANIHTTLGEMKSDARTQSRLLIGVLLAILGWMAVQLYAQATRPAPVPVTDVSPR